MIEPKRRGRPPGKRLAPATPPPPPDESEYETLLIFPELKIILSFRQALGDPSSEVEINWPRGWRMPEQGEMIHVRKDLGGIVQTIDWLLDTETVVVHIR